MATGAAENWQPHASLENLRLRANILRQIREFFAARQILEVETPLLSHATVTDPHLSSLQTEFTPPGEPSKTLYLQTSPEFGMKRLLAAGSGAIYQICKAFRDSEAGRFHNPEFTMLEWYRPGFDHHQLMDETDELLKSILNCSSAERLSYEDVFQRELDVNPHQANPHELRECAQRMGLALPSGMDVNSSDNWLFLLMSHFIEPKLGHDCPVFIYDFPASQAALARTRKINAHISVAERFEVYVKGIELANGYHELADAKEQARRFVEDQQNRLTMKLPQVVQDERLVSALESGFPDCAGIALGIDRLVLLAAKGDRMADVVSFMLDRA